MKAIRVLMILAAVIAIATPCIAGQENTGGDTTVTSENLERKDDKYNLSGSVVMRSGEAIMRSDNATMDDKTNILTAEGNVFYLDADVEIFARSAEIDMATKMGTMLDAEILVKQDGMRIRGGRIIRTGQKRFYIDKASATPCESIPPDWCIAGSNVDVEIGERIKADHATFRILDVPVLYSPYVWAPIITERRSGLLPPTFGYKHSRGFFYRQPYFWAISENRDTTIVMDYYTKSALGQALEYRYMESPLTSGSMNLYRLRDNIRKRTYYEFLGRHRQDEGQSGGMGGFVDINYLNYREFYRLYEPYVETSSKRFLASTAEAHYKWHGNSRFYALTTKAQDLKDDVDKDTVLQKTAETGYVSAPIGIGDSTIFGRAWFSNFERRLGYDGRRTALEAKTAYKIGQGPVLTQSVSARKAFYEFRYENNKDEAMHTLFHDYNATLESIFERKYQSGIGHGLEPSISYYYSALEGTPTPTFDSLEMMSAEASVITASIMNRAFDRTKDYVTLRVSQSYDFNKPRDAFTPMSVDAVINGPLTITANLLYDHYAGKFTTANATESANIYRTDIALGQRYARDTNVTLYTLDLSHRAAGGFTLETGVRYDDSEEGMEEFRAAVKYQSQCWSTKVSYIKKPDDYTVYLEIGLLGLGEYGVKKTVDTEEKQKTSTTAN